MIENNVISNLGPVTNYSCGIWEYTGTGVAGNKLAGNRISDGYCGIGAVAADTVTGASYNNTLYTILNSDLPKLPGAVEP